MGIISGIVTEIAKELTADASLTVLDKLKQVVNTSEEKRQSKFDEYTKNLISKSPNNKHFWMKEDSDYNHHTSWSTYSFYGMDGQLAYVAKGGKDSKRQRIQLYDRLNRKVGEVSENRLTHTKLFSDDWGASDYTLSIGSSSLGIIRWKKNQARVLFNDWSVILRTFRSALVKRNDGTIAAEQTTKHLSLDSFSFLDFSYAENEVLLILIFLSIEANYKKYGRKMERMTGY